MKKSAVLWIMFILVASSVFVGCEDSSSGHRDNGKDKYDVYYGPKKTVAVVDFANKTNYGGDKLGSAAADLLITRLVKSGRFVVLERSNIKKVMEEQGFQASAMVDASTAVEAGRILGTNAVVVGSITDFGTKRGGFNVPGYISVDKMDAKCVVTVRLVDVKTGEVLLSEEAKGKASSKAGRVRGVGTGLRYDETLVNKALTDAFEEVFDVLIDGMTGIPWETSIVKVSGGNCYLKAGKSSNLQIGDVLRVFRQGEEIRDPDTGVVLARDENPIGDIKIIKHMGERVAVCKTISSQRTFAVKDVVRFLRPASEDAEEVTE